MIRVQQSCLTSYEKYHYTTELSSKHDYRTKQSRKYGGSLKAGEMEIHQMAGNGLAGVLKEMHMRSDICVTSCCGEHSPLCVHTR